MNKRKVYGIFGSAWAFALTLAVAASAAPPTGYLEANIGEPDEPGSVEVDASGEWTVNGAGNRWDGNFEDQLYFVYKTIRGNGGIQASLLEETEPGDQYAGVMVRGSVEPNAVFAGLIMSTDEVTWIRRTEVDENAVRTSGIGPEVYPRHMRVQRVGNSISGFLSDDGKLWTQVTGPLELPLAETTEMGIAVSTRTGVLGTTRYANVQVLEGVVTVSGAEGAASDTRALLSWQPITSTNLVGYNIYRGASLDQLALVNTAGPTTDTFFFEESQAGTSLRNNRYAVAGVFKNADGTNLEGPMVLVR
jgi:hypothetical protein